MLLIATEPTNFNKYNVVCDLNLMLNVNQNFQETITTLIRLFEDSVEVLDSGERRKVDRCYKLIDDHKFNEAEREIDKLTEQFGDNCPDVVGLNTALNFERE